MTTTHTGTVPRGKNRRQLVDRVAYARARWELEAEGVSIEPLDARYVRRHVHRDPDHRQTIHVSEAFVAEVARAVAHWKRDIVEFESAEDRLERERKNAWLREQFR